MTNHTPDHSHSGAVESLDQAAARFQMAATFYESACLDHPDLVAFYRALLIEYADRLASVSKGATDAAA